MDAWGNLSAIGPTADTAYAGCTQQSGFSKTPDAANHLSGFSYDASGNTFGDGIYSYLWDGESQLKSAGGVTYLYDGEGRRVSKSNGKLYWYGSGGEILAETNASGGITNEYIFFGGKRIALLPVGSAAQFYAEDFLGSSRVVTTNTGVVCYDADFSPYGGERTLTNSCTQNAYKFEGKERDAETSNDDFGARYYTWRFGRWLSADWSNVPVAVPYANFTNPQTLNLYSMVADDPESFADLDGHCDITEKYGCMSGSLDNKRPPPVCGCLPQPDRKDQKADPPPPPPPTTGAIPGKLPPGANPKAVRLKYETKPQKPGPPPEPAPEPNPRPAPEFRPKPPGGISPTAGPDEPINPPKLWQKVVLGLVDAIRAIVGTGGEVVVPFTLPPECKNCA